MNILEYGKIVAILSDQYGALGDDTLTKIAGLIEDEMAPKPNTVSVEQIQVLMYSFIQDSKIEMIKKYRELTGASLADAKSNVEWFLDYVEVKKNSRIKKEMTDSIDQQLNTGFDSRESFVLDGFSDDELLTIKSFVESFN